MKRLRLRPAHDEAALARIYARPHDHTQWIDHKVRVQVTAALIRSLSGRLPSVADLSCGDASIVSAVRAETRILGDFAPGHEYTGPIEATIEQIPAVTLFVCCETLEHLDNPDVTLKAIRGKTEYLAVSTPVEAFDDRNLEHYWAWDREAVEAMLNEAGFTVNVYSELDLRPANGEYSFGIWWCR